MKLLVSYEDGVWHAQGLEYDIGASGSSRDEALEMFQLIVRVETSIAIEQGNFEAEVLPIYPDGFSIADTLANYESIDLTRSNGRCEAVGTDLTDVSQ